MADDGAQAGKLETEALMVLVKGIRATSFMADPFVKKLAEEFPDAKVGAVTIYIPIDGEGKKVDRLTLGHRNRDELADGTLLAESNNPEHLKKLLKIVETFRGDQDGNK